MNNYDTLLSNDEAAKYLGVAIGTLEVWRSTQRYKIPYIKVGRLVRYRLSHLKEFLARRTMGEDAITVIEPYEGH